MRATTPKKVSKTSTKKETTTMGPKYIGVKKEKGKGLIIMISAIYISLKNSTVIV